MRHLQRRVERLERRNAAGAGEELLLVVERMPPARMTAEEEIDRTALGWRLGEERVLDVLRKAGQIRADGCMRVLRNTDIA